MASAVRQADYSELSAIIGRGNRIPEFHPTL